MKMRMLMLLGFGLTFVSSVAMADGTLGEKSLKDTDLRGAQCSLMKKNLPSQTQSSQQAGTADTGKSHDAAEAK